MDDAFITLAEALERGTDAVGDRALQQLLAAVEKGHVTAMCRADGEWKPFGPKWVRYIARFGDPEHVALATHGENGFRFDLTDRNAAARRGILDVPDHASEIEVEAAALDRLWPEVRAAVAPPVPTGPKKRGPKPGTVTGAGYTKQDAALFPEIERRMAEQGISLHKVTLQLVEEGKVAGAGTVDSLHRRLRKAYAERTVTTLQLVSD